MSDSWADTEIRFDGDSWGEAGTNLYGCLKQLYLLKKQNRHLKVLLSIGGWTYSSNFATAASTASYRTNFASSTVSLVKNFGLDGIDVDWEYPADDTQATNFVLLLQAVREALDAYGKSLDPPYHFTLTVACPAGPTNYQRLHLAEMDQYLDFWNLMAYDYAGSWNTVTGNQANLFSPTNCSTCTTFDTETGIKYYISKGIAPSKITLGMPLYGRSFKDTEGLGMPFIGVGRGDWEPGVYDLKNLPPTGVAEFYDNITGSSYSFDPTTRELVSYDNVAVAEQKAAWIKSTGLGGAMWWESSGDGPGNLSSIQTVVRILGDGDDSALDSIPNELSYPNTTFDNLRSGMQGHELEIYLLAPTADTSTFQGKTSLSAFVASAPCDTQSPSTSTITTTSTSTATNVYIVTCSSPISSSSTYLTPSSFSTHSVPFSFSSSATTTSSFSSSSTLTRSIIYSSSPLTTIASSSSIGSSNYGCATGGICKTYSCVSCMGGKCFCGLDSDGNPTCFRDEECNKTCSTNDDCDSGKGCIMNSCCGSGGYCISLAIEPASCNNGGGKKCDHGGGFGVYQGSGSCSE